MKVRFLIRKEPQNPHWWQLPQAPEDKSCTCFLLASFPGTMGSFPICSASWSEGERDKSVMAQDPLEAAWLPLGTVRMERRATLLEKQSKACTLSSVLSSTSSVVSSSTEMSGHSQISWPQ